MSIVALVQFRALNRVGLWARLDVGGIGRWSIALPKVLELGRSTSLSLFVQISGIYPRSWPTYSQAYGIKTW